MISQNLLQSTNYQWIDISELRQEDFDRIANEYKLPYLLVLDTLKPEHLPKYECTEEGAHFFMLRSYDNNSQTDASSIQEFSRKFALFVTDERIVTIHRGKADFLKPIIEKVQKTDFKSPQLLVHSILLALIRTYEAPTLLVQDNYDEFEVDILSKQKEQLDTSRIYFFRRQVSVLKRILKQTNDSLSRSKDFWEEHPSLLQDLKENINQVYFQLDDVTINFEHLFELHIALNDQRANDVMKVLTVFSTILLPLNFIASFYGMNFATLPGIDSSKAFWGTVGVMIILCLFGVWYFKKKGWFYTSKE